VSHVNTLQAQVLLCHMSTLYRHKYCCVTCQHFTGTSTAVSHVNTLQAQVLLCHMSTLYRHNTAVSHVHTLQAHHCCVTCQHFTGSNTAVSHVNTLQAQTLLCHMSTLNVPFIKTGTFVTHFYVIILFSIYIFAM
jgi:hypothetical protein